MKIRKAIREDIEDIYPLFLKLIESEEDFFKSSINFFDKIGEKKKEFERNSKNELLKDIKKKNSILFVAEEKRKIIGYLSGNFVNAKNPFYKSIVLGYLKHIFVLEEFRGKGVANELIKKLEGWFRGKKCKFIYLEVFSVNPSVEKFKKWNYREVTCKMWKELK